ncbi:CoA transferase [bacterium]|nr:MAG: CoA transferase [bacterium]MCL4230861.1 CoA transferase [Dehalococcoidia bacterium]
MLPLEGVRVCDLTIAQFGAHATMMLADMGAEVIKIESPRGGDPGRGVALQPNGISPFFQAHNRGKKSITVNLRRPEGKEIVRRLAARSEVFVQSWKPGVIERLELDYEHIRAANPAIIYASATGFGPKGPRAHLAAMDMVAQAAGGFAWANSPPGAQEPNPAGPTIADQAGSLVLAYGILAAFVHRLRAGEGQQVDVSLLGSQMTMQAWNIASFFLSGEQVRGGRAGANSPIFTLYRASDGWFGIAIIDERQWPLLCQVIGQPGLADDPRFNGRAPREANRADLTAVLESAFAGRSRAEWLSAMEAHDIPCGPANSYADLASDPQVRANGYLVEVDIPGAGKLTEVGPPVALGGAPPPVRSAAPELGQHTEQVLLDLGYNWDDIASLRESRVIL